MADVLTSSGEVHGVLSVIVDLNGLGESLGVTAIALARHVAAFSTARQTDQVASDGRSPASTLAHSRPHLPSPVVVLVHQVVARSEGH